MPDVVGFFGPEVAPILCERRFPFELYCTLLTTLDIIGSSKLLDRMLSTKKKTHYFTIHPCRCFRRRFLYKLGIVNKYAGVEKILIFPKGFVDFLKFFHKLMLLLNKHCL